MRGVIAKPHVCAPVVFSSRWHSRIPDRSNVAANLPFTSKTAFPCIKLKSNDRVLQAPALLTPYMKDIQWENNVFYGHLMQEIQKDNLLHGHLLHLPAKRGPCLPRASNSYPPMTEKPKWWWRSLAGLPYLMLFYDQLCWTLANPANNPPPFLENFHNLFFPLVVAIAGLPQFFRGAYQLIFYFGIVRRKEWPHFFRFHVMMVILMGCLVQAIGLSSSWLPTWAYPPHFWSAATFLFLVTVIECVRCALTGYYSGFPFVKDAAFVHSDLNLF